MTQAILCIDCKTRKTLHHSRLCEICIKKELERVNERSNNPLKMEEDLVCLECNWSHGKTYIGDNKIKEYSTKDKMSFKTCDDCVSAILDSHFLNPDKEVNKVIQINVVLTKEIKRLTELLNDIEFALHKKGLRVK